jgi:hypothetical protein
MMTTWPPVGWGFLLLIRAAVLRVRRQSRIALATVLAAIASLIGTTEWMPLLRTWEDATSLSARAGAGMLPLRLVSWNPAGSSPLAEIEGLSPDICFLQEIGALGAAARQSAAWSGYHVLEGFDPGILGRYPMKRLATERVCSWQRRG